MRNRAKCKLCNDIIESIHQHDYTVCLCGEIAVDGGPEYLRCLAKNWFNFLRIDDDDNEVSIKIKTKEDEDAIEPTESTHIEAKPSRSDLISMIDTMIYNIEMLPTKAMITPITHYDYMSLLLLLSSIFKAESDS